MPAEMGGDEILGGEDFGNISAIRGWYGSKALEYVVYRDFRTFSTSFPGKHKFKMI